MADDNPEIADERTLAQVIAQKGVLNVESASKIMLQLAKAVSNLHAEGRLHRNISADTVYLNKDMSVTLAPVEPKVTLGGIGVDLVDCPPQLQNIAPLSLSGEIKEVKQVLTEAGILIDPRQIDYYQLGALLCFMVSGRSVRDYLCSCKAKADVPQVIRPTIDRALGLNAKEQFESGQDFILELEAVISGKEMQQDRPGLPDSVFISKKKDENQLPFDKLGHYEILECIGNGGMGDVYKGYEKALDRFVAIKVLPSQLARQNDFVKRFHCEAAAIAQIDHPNIVRIYYSGEDNGNHFFAMQYVEGESLADLLNRRKKLTADEALPTIEQCLAGIGAIHEKGLIHRDIKPGNVLLDHQTKRALITDFGVVKSANAHTQMTVTGTVMGTADYIAPEQASGAEVDSRTDLYAMGILMYQMLSGKLPFGAKSATSMMFQHAYEPPPPLLEVAPDVPKQLADIVMKLIAKKPVERFQSTGEVLCELRRIGSISQNTKGSSQTRIIELPLFNDCPDISADLSKLAGSNWFGRMRNRIVDFFGRHTPQVFEYTQTTTQQVDSAVAQYQRQCDNLTSLAQEAKAAIEDFENQARSLRKAAQLADQRAENANDAEVKEQALKEKLENEQAAAELSQLAAQQHQQAEEIDHKLAKLKTKLARLSSQRDALNARMIAAQAHLGKDLLLSNRKRRIRFACVLFLIGLLILSVFVAILTGGKDESPAGNLQTGDFVNPVGKWQTVDFVRTIDAFIPGEVQQAGIEDIHLKKLSIYKDGTTSGPWTWEENYLWHPGDQTKDHFVIKEMNGEYFLFMEWNSGDVTIRGQKPWYYVFKKVSKDNSLTGQLVSITPVGKWQTVDFVRNIEVFERGELQWTGDLSFKDLSFFTDGTTSGPWTWEKDWLWHSGDKTKAHFVIKQFNNEYYLFMEWMSGDVTIRGEKPWYYVFKNVDETVAYIVSFKAIEPYNPRTSGELLNTFNNRHAEGTRTSYFRTEIENDKLIGHICVDDELGATTLEKLLNSNSKLTFLGARAVNMKEFGEHCRLRQMSLPQTDPSHSTVVYSQDLSVDGIVVHKSTCNADFICSLLGAPDRVDERILRYSDSGIDFCFSTSGPLSEIHLNRGFKGKLDTGVSLASTKKDVFETYGNPVRTLEILNLHQQNDDRILYTREKGRQSRIYYGSCGLVFLFADEEISQIVLFKGLMQRGGADSAVPQLVSSWPQIFADNIEPSLDKITVTFNKEMNGGSWSWTSCGSETYPQMTGKPYYDPEKRTCTLPVKLEPGKVYWVGVNSVIHKNFRSKDGIPAKSDVILFATKDSDGQPTKIPPDLLREAKLIYGQN